MKVINVRNVLNVIGKTENGGVPALTPALFRANAGTGTWANPAEVNDGEAGAVFAYTNVIDDTHIEVDFGSVHKFKQWRVSCDPQNAGDGEVGIYYWSAEAVWVLWKQFVQTNTGVFTDWSVESEVESRKIRLIYKVIDSSDGYARIREIEIKY